MIAKIAVAAATYRADRLYDYLIPEELVGAVELGGDTATDGEVADAGAEVGFAYSDGSQQEDVTVVVEESEAGQFIEECPVVGEVVVVGPGVDTHGGVEAGFVGS